MTAKMFSGLAAAIFAFVAMMHLVRIMMGWEIVIGAHSIPTGASWLGALITSALAWLGFRAARG